MLNSKLYVLCLNSISVFKFRENLQRLSRKNLNLHCILIIHSILDSGYAAGYVVSGYFSRGLQNPRESREK